MWVGARSLTGLCNPINLIRAQKESE
jgi:hypothetical protein